MELFYLSKFKRRLFAIRLWIYVLLCLPFSLTFVLSLYLPQTLAEQEPGVQFAILFSGFILLALSALHITERTASTLKLSILKALLKDLNTHFEWEQVLTAYAPMVKRFNSLQAPMEVGYQLEIAPPRLLWNRGSNTEHICKEPESGLWKRMLGYGISDET